MSAPWVVGPDAPAAAAEDTDRCTPDPTEPGVTAQHGLKPQTTVGPHGGEAAGPAVPYVQPPLAAQLDEPGVETSTPPPRAITITVHGRPITQGSKTKGRYGNIRDANAATLKPWRDNVRSAAVDARADQLPILGPVEVDIVFTFDRPASHYGTGRNAGTLKATAPTYPANVTSGDIDKLQRSCFDALTDAQVWKDDAQVVRVEADKLYADHEHAMAGPGVVIHVRPMP